jgi:uncharacterized protein YkwD
MQKRYFSRLVLSAAVVWVAACSGGGAGGPTSPSINVDSVELNSFSLVNKERAQASTITELERHAVIAQLAREYSERMRDQGFFDHRSPDGGDLESRLRKAGVPFMAAAENLAKVTNHADPATFAHTILMQQPHHRENILAPRYELLGVGAAKSGDTVWITQIFVEY